MQESMQRFDNTNVLVQTFRHRGRGLVATRRLDAGELVVSAPVHVLSGIEFYLMRILPCIMHTFAWDRPRAEGGETAAIAFGLISLCNHSDDKSNTQVLPIPEDSRIDLVALRTIEPGEELLIRYKSVPFEPA